MRLPEAEFISTYRLSTVSIALSRLRVRVARSSALVGAEFSPSSKLLVVIWCFWVFCRCWGASVVES